MARSAWYQVELIVFVHNSNRALQAEFWPAEPGRPLEDNALYLVDLKTFQSMGGDNHSMLIKLSPNQMDLNDITRKLSRGGDYQPLFHAAWRQLVQPRAQAKPIYIRGGQTLPPPIRTMDSMQVQPGTSQPGMQVQPGMPGPIVQNKPLSELEGTVTVSLGTYLHVNFDLLYTMRNPKFRANIMPQSAMTGSALPENEQQTDDMPAPVAQPPQYLKFRMVQHRRMRSKKLHYVDNPKIGAFVQILPYKAGTPSNTGGGTPGDIVTPLKR